MKRRIVFIVLLLLLAFVARQQSTPGVELAQDLYLHPSGNVINLVIPINKKADLFKGKVDNKFLMNRIYEVFQDSFDFVFFIYDDYRKPDSLYYGKCFPVQNTAQGIGKKIFDQSQEFGSFSKLKGIIHLTRNTAIREGPILHELMHIWGNDIMKTDIAGHWGYTGVGGQLGGFQRLVHLRDNYYKGFVEGHTGFSLESNWGNTTPYSPLELYLMGLLPPEDVPPIKIAINPEGDPSHNGLFTAEGIDTICIEDIIRENGERQPDFLSSQESFRGLVVLVSDAPVSEFLFDKVSDDAKQFSLQGPPRRNWREWPNWWGKENFYSATQGLACLELGFLEEVLRSNDPEESISMRN